MKTHTQESLLALTKPRQLPGVDGPCLEWQRGRVRDGYGHAQHLGKVRSVHRLMFILEHGPIPSHVHVCHACDNPPCINIAHLWAGSYASNIADREAKGRTARGEKLAAPKSEAHKEKIRAAHKGRVFTPEHRAKTIAARWPK